MTRLLAVDWGTSSLRCALIDSDGGVLEERSFARGILTVTAGEFRAVFEECFGVWMTPRYPLPHFRHGWQSARLARSALLRLSGWFQ